MNEIRHIHLLQYCLFSIHWNTLKQNLKFVITLRGKIHSLVLSYLITFQQKFKAAHNGAKKKKKRIQGGGERQKGKQEASI